MTAKEFNLVVSLILEMLKDGKTDRVIELLEEAKDSNNASNAKKNKDD